MSQVFKDNHIFNKNKKIKNHNLDNLEIGCPLVHLDHGVGRYGGMKILETNKIASEYIIINYADEDKLYVPVTSLHLVSYYNSSNENIPLHKLGNDIWSKAKKKALLKIRDIAVELLDLYANRKIQKGFIFKFDIKKYNLFCKNFLFNLTKDQKNTINDVVSDMKKPIAMDRLVCGDVGFGKTEIAMRAAFIAIQNNKQVAILIPTTLLAQQHLYSFRERFFNWSVRIEMLSRFCTSKEQKEIIKNTCEGKVNILIGTHKLLNSKIKWHNLGLLIVDEEHRFGVQQKEKIKAMRANIDILTLTATPIPRTLNMAMIGIRDISIIATPPEFRLPIKTFIKKYDENIIRKAILSEILRDGQVYYVCNNIINIDETAKKISILVPEAKIAIGHGRMKERDLACIMSDFKNKKFNVLICTTIVETGIDIPTANTIIIERADYLGLAQLYQLRGRVGRSNHQAYAWLLTPNLKEMSDHAYKRLSAIEKLEMLGAGFTLATHDLEIRGAGELLGKEQSGQIDTIGFTLYMQMLKDAVIALKNGNEPSLYYLKKNHTEIDLKIPAILPENFIHHVPIRLSFYKKIASISNHNDLNFLKKELKNNFGPLPSSVSNLFTITSIRIMAQKIGIYRIDANIKEGFIDFFKKNKINSMWLVKLFQKEPKTWKIINKTRLKFMYSFNDENKRIEWIYNTIKNMMNNSI